jgi:hypothetical protein
MKRIKTRLWIEMVATICGIACVLVVFFVTVGAASRDGSDDSGQAEPVAASQAQRLPAAKSTRVASSAAQTAEAQPYEGVVTDAHCGAKHSPDGGLSAAGCTRSCVHAGQHFALVDGDKVYVLEGEAELLKQAAGERVTVIGTLNDKTISVASVRMPAP